MCASENLKNDIRYIKHVGEARARLFNRLGVFTAFDMLHYYPREYEDRNKIKNIIDIADGEKCTVKAIAVSQVNSRKVKNNLTIQKTAVRDETGYAYITWFNQPYIKNKIKPGEKYFFYGKIKRNYSGTEIMNPVYEKIASDKSKPGIIPIYPTTAGLSLNIIRKVVNQTIKKYLDNIKDLMPENIKSKYNLKNKSWCIKTIHAPDNLEDYKAARKTLAFEELLILQMGLFVIKNSLKREKKGICFIHTPDINEFIGDLPFSLTGAQKRVFNEIENDMQSSKIMNRLVQGDVGSGKTVIAVLAFFLAVKSGYQCAMMAPTEILAAQHFKTVNKMLEKWGIKVVLLTGSTGKRKKDEILGLINEGKADVIIGTHALIEQAVKYNNLGLVVTDEQHRFGVRQRTMLAGKGKNPDVIVMTATPIPRTLALILYGDLDISVIDEMPPGRKPVKTYAVDEKLRYRIYRFIRKEVENKKQVYIVCPLIEDSEAIEAKSAVELADELKKQHFADLKVGLIYGKMKQKEKDLVMKKFAGGEIDILVSTTVIEVGVDVPNASVMIIENAERFGLAQLHQLRGRVGRGNDQSYCIMFCSKKGEIAAARMEVMTKTTDGFVISEKDLELRGPGEFFGTRQHGIPDLKAANLYKDIDILKQAQKAAAEILENDRFLEKEENKELKESILDKFENSGMKISFN